MDGKEPRPMTYVEMLRASYEQRFPRMSRDEISRLVSLEVADRATSDPAFDPPSEKKKPAKK